MLGSAIIGHRAGRENAAGDAVRSAGIRVFLFWLAVVMAAFLVPGGSGNVDCGRRRDQHSVRRHGHSAVGYILFGIMHHPAIAAVGAGIAAAFYIPSYLAGDSAEVIVAAATLIVVALGAVWIRKSGVT